MDHCAIDFFADDATFHISGKMKSKSEPKLQYDGDGQNYTKYKCITIKPHVWH